jgi:hypothetical protein
MRFATIVFSLLLLTLQPLAAAELFRCRILDAVEPSAGRIVRSAGTAADIKLFNSIIVDTATATLRVGETQFRFGEWRKLYDGSSAGRDFVAALPSGDSIKLRVWEEPAQMVLTQGDRIFVGLCDPIR